VPRGAHPVKRTYDSSAVLNLNGQPVALLRSVSAMVGASAAPPVTFVVGGLETVGLMLRDALTGARLWFGSDGQIWSTDS
jgi:hypothetical protein